MADVSGELSHEDLEAKLLGRVGRGHLPEIKFLKRTLRWHDEEASFSWSGGSRYVEALAQLLGRIGDRAATKTPGGGGRRSTPRDALVLKRQIRGKRPMRLLVLDSG